MIIRCARAEDARDIAMFISMAESEMVHIFTGTTDEEKSLGILGDFILNPVPNRYSLANNLVAELDGRVAGSLIHFPADSQPELDRLLLESLNRRGFNLDRLFFEGEPGTYYLSTMGVHPDFRGRGVGSALMAAGEKEGRERGFEQATLLVSKGKPKAQNLYAKKGYSIIREVEIGEVEYYRMAKELR